VNGGQLLVHYPITLPADYDMGTIRTRVRTRGGALDDRRGLGVKAYCIREAGVAGSPVNQYAPFYLWADSAAAAAFLWEGQGFDGIVRDFGRPRARTWVPAAVAAGGCARADVTRAVLRTWSIDPDADLVEAAAAARSRVGAHAGDPDVHLSVAGIDPATWEVVEFRTTSAAVTAAPGETGYAVLHVSQPGPL
jgi:uncharacterized protein DUF4865